MHRPAAALAALLLAACPGLLPSDTDSGSDGTTSTNSGPPPTTAPDPATTDFKLECYPGTRRCDPNTPGVLQECKATGLDWESLPCSENEDCVDDPNNNTASCIGPCERIDNPTSVGCEFLAIRMNSHNEPEDADALIVGNTDKTRTARLQLWFTPNNSLTEQPLFDPVELPPGESHIFELTNDILVGYTSFRNGGVYRVESDIPVTAYLHSTLANLASNDASMLLPIPTLRQDYVIASYPGFADPKQPDKINGRPSYFNVIAVEDDTTVEWVSPQPTAAQGVIIPGVKAGETGRITLNRFDVLQIGSSSQVNTDPATHDLSGTVVTANKKIWVMGATKCAFVPFGVGYCNHLQEQMIPLEYWGKKYVGPHSPPRGGEKHYWRVYAGKGGVTVTIESNDAGFKVQPFTLAERGAWKEIEVPHGVSLIFTATGPILPVQYLTGSKGASDLGDPAMYQMIAVEQWLNRYAFVTGVDYNQNYAQVIRKKGGADITINGEVVTGYYLINGTGTDNQWEVADVLLAEGDEAHSYLAESADPFNIVVVGYQTFNGTLGQSAYAYPGGMNLKKIYTP